MTEANLVELPTWQESGCTRTIIYKHITNHIYEQSMFSLGVWSAVQFVNMAPIGLIGASSTVNNLELVPL